MNQLTQQHRAQQLALRAATVRQLQALWPTLDWARLDETYPTFAATTAQLVARNRNVSSGLASAYLRAFRAQHLGGDFKPVFAQPMPAEQFATSLRVTSVVAAKKAASEGVAGDAAMRNALTQTTGSMARLVLNAGRETLIQTLAADPAEPRWRRVLGGGGCDWCRMLATRDNYLSEASGSFDAHDHCGCTAEPVYG